MRMTKKILSNDYFSKLNIPSDVLIDSLTKVLNRRYIMSYVSYLIKKEIPFSLAIIDVDNFKFYNDSFGHMVGDKILTSVANTICESIDERCYVGRYGGDEFIVVLVGDDSYDVEWSNLKHIFVEIRRPMQIDILSLNVTCTAGSASFPKDGTSLDEIFQKADRTLYRGKIKGRNCFVIYVKEKHQDLDYVKEVSLPVKMDRLYSLFKGEQDTYFEMYEALLYLANDFKTDAAGIFEVNKPPLIYRTDVELVINRISEDALESHYENNVIVINNRSNLDQHSRLRLFMDDHNIRALIVSKILAKDNYYGYLMVYQEHPRIWQDEDIALIKYFASIVGLSLYHNYYIEEEE